jgi:hypothetical protein
LQAGLGSGDAHIGQELHFASETLTSGIAMMPRLRTHVVAPVVLGALVFTLGPATSLADVEVELTRVGNPIWRPADFHLLAAPAEPEDVFFATADLIVGPANPPPRPPPYDNIISDNMAAAGFVDATTFLPSDIDGAPRGVYFGYVLIPDPGTTGSSHDFASGPIIPNSVFPMISDADLVREGVVVDDVFESEFGAAAGFDGHSHILTLLASDAVFFPPGTQLTGNYHYLSSERDAQGNGWDIVARFQVVPEPAGVTVLLLASACLGLVRPSRLRAGR